MKFIFIVGNWKSHKTNTESLDWFKQFYAIPVEANNKEIVVCPPATFLSPLKDFKDQNVLNNNLLLRFGSQDISSMDEGAYTGEVSGKALQEFCAYSIIGHSERRKYFNETDEILTKKVNMALQYNIIPIYCVQGVETPVPQGVSIVAYEPIEAIGTGNPDTPEDASSVAKSFKENHGINYVLYGGSVSPDNVHSFTQMENIDGVLVGGASLDPTNFMQIIKNA